MSTGDYSGLWRTLDEDPLVVAITSDGEKRTTVFVGPATVGFGRSTLPELSKTEDGYELKVGLSSAEAFFVAQTLERIGLPVCRKVRKALGEQL